MMETAYTQSLADNEESVDKFLIDSFSDLLSKLHLIDLRNGWISHHSEDNYLHFLKILITDSGPIIERSVLIDHDLFIKAFGINNIPICISRISINDTRQIESSLYEVDNFSTPTHSEHTSTEHSINNYVKLAINELENAINLVECDTLDLDVTDDLFTCTESIKFLLYFIVGQLTNLNHSENNRRYDILTQVFSLKIHGLSPACYRNIQSSNCLILPHERNLLHIKNTLGIDGDYFRILKEITSKFSDR